MKELIKQVILKLVGPEDLIRMATDKEIMAVLEEKLPWKPKWEIFRFKDHDDYMAAKEWDGLLRNPNNPFLMDYSCFDGNLLLNEGIEGIWARLSSFASSPSVTVYDNTNARIGVGDSTTAEAATQTGLQGGNTYFQGMDSGYPLGSGTGNTTLEFQATVGGSNGNFAWNEFTVDNGASQARNLNRKVSSQGTKGVGQTWTVKVSFQGS